MRPHIFVVLHVAGFMSSLWACALGCGEKSHVETNDLVSGAMGANSTSASGADSDSDSVALSSATAATPSNPGDGGDGMSADDDPSEDSDAGELDCAKSQGLPSEPVGVNTLLAGANVHWPYDGTYGGLYQVITRRQHGEVADDEYIVRVGIFDVLYPSEAPSECGQVLDELDGIEDCGLEWRTGYKEADAYEVEHHTLEQAVATVDGVGYAMVSSAIGAVASRECQKFCVWADELRKYGSHAQTNTDSNRRNGRH